jgi:hypothetical protein
MSNQFEIVAQGILFHRTGRGAYMPVITELSDGAFIACQHVGQQLGSADNYIEVLCTESLRKGDSATWELLASIGEAEEGWSYRGPDINGLPNGQLLMTASRFQAVDDELFNPDSEGLQRPELILLRSDDRGATWSPPQIVPVDLPPEKYTWNKAGRLVQFSPSRWMFPFETWKPEGYTGLPDQKAAAVFSSDQGRTWGELTVIADDTSGKLLWWDQLNARLPDGRLYVMLWTHVYGTKEDLVNHWAVSSDEGRTWSDPKPTNLRGQVCCPIALPDGRVAAIYNHRHEPQGVRIAVTEDLSAFDLENEVVVFDAGAEATLGQTNHENFLAEHMLIAFGKPVGSLLSDGDLLVSFWCTVGGVTHTRWVRLRMTG